jgi:hypothetical protein
LTWVEVSAPAPDEVSTPKPEPVPAQTTSAPMERLELVLASGMTVRVPPNFEPEAPRRLPAVVG